MMDSANAKWEVVSGSKKGKVDQRQTKKNIANKMPKIDTAPPVKESPTIYKMLNPDEEQKSTKTSSSSQPKQAEQSSPTSSSKKKATKQKADMPKKVDKVTLETAIKQLNVGELETVLSKDRETFPGSPSVWLKDLGSVLKLQLDVVPELDPVLEGKPHDFPLSLIPKSTQKVINAAMRECTDKTLELFFEHCLQTMLADFSKGVATYGTRVMIQILAKHKPDIIKPVFRNVVNL